MNFATSNAYKNLYDNRNIYVLEICHAKNRNLSIRNFKLLYFKRPLAHLIMNNLDGFLSIRNCFHRNVKLFNGLLSHLIGYK